LHPTPGKIDAIVKDADIGGEEPIERRRIAYEGAALQRFHH
jgi:hypothetical protein